MLGQDAVRVPAAPRRARARVAAQRALSRRAATGRGPAKVTTGGTWFLLDHAKFLALIEPVSEALGQQRQPVIWAHSDLRPASRATDLALDELAVRAPRLGAAGPALDGMGELLLAAQRTVAALTLARPDRLIVVEGNSPYDALAAAAGRAVGVPTICLQNGWSPIIHAGFRRMPYRRMCVWGEGFASLLAPFNAGLDLVTTGHPALADGGEHAPPAWAPPTTGPTAAFFLQPTSPYNAPEHLDAMLALVQDVATAAPEATVIVREHPGHPLTPRRWPPNVVVANAPEVALRDVIAAARVAVSIYSTSLIEAAAAGRPAISLNQTALPRLSPDLEAEGAGREVRDRAVARDVIVDLLRSDEALARFAPGMARVRERYFDGLRPGAPGRVADAVCTATI
jgi:hypothetical protein